MTPRSTEDNKLRRNSTDTVTLWPLSHRLYTSVRTLLCQRYYQISLVVPWPKTSLKDELYRLSISLPNTSAGTGMIVPTKTRSLYHYRTEYKSSEIIMYPTFQVCRMRESLRQCNNDRYEKGLAHESNRNAYSVHQFERVSWYVIIIERLSR
jgi:hypothetical protein